MSIRLLLSPVALIAAVGSAALGQQASPSAAAKTFTLDSMAPTPTPTPTPTPGVTPDSAATPDAAASPAPTDPATPTPAPILASPTVPESAAVASPVAADAAPAPAPAVRAVFTLDTPVQDLVADPGAKAVLDMDLPGMSTDENLDKFKMLSLRSLQPQTGGQLTDAMLAKVAADLDVLGGGTGAVAQGTPIKVGTSKRNQDASR